MQFNGNGARDNALNYQENSGQQASTPNSVSSSKMGPVRARQEKIQQLVQAKGFVTIDFLSREFNVTPQTIRRDINTLSKTGKIHRYHGGAGAPSSSENVAYTERKVLCLAEKQQIARLIAERIPDHASLFINIGTTTEEVAKALCLHHQRLRVVTNNLNVASIFSGNENFEIIVAGGLFRHRDCGIIGEAAIEFINKFKVDFGIIGISGIDLDGTLLDFDYREVRTARAIMQNSRHVFLAADHTKFGRNAMVRLGNISEINALFTDRQPPAPLAEALAEQNVGLYVAETENNTYDKLQDPHPVEITAPANDSRFN